MKTSKRNMGLVLICAAAFPIVAQAQSVDYSIVGKISHINPGKIYLRYTEGGKRITDSTVLKDGQFHFTGKISEPLSASINYIGEDKTNKTGADTKSIFLEKGTINISGKDNLKDALVIGGINNKDNNILQEELKTNKDRIRDLINSYYGLSKDEQKDTAKTNPLEREIDELQDAQKKTYLDFAKSHKNSFVALDAIKGYAGYTIDYNTVNPLFSQLSPSIKASIAGKEFEDKLKKVEKISIGRIAPDFTQNDTSDHPVTLSSLRGKYVLVDFWASWCGPCRAENPNVVKAYEKYKDHKFTIIGVSLDQPNGKEKWIQAIHHDNLTWTQVSDLKFWNNDVAKLYAVQSIPQNFLLDPSGKIIAKNLRGEDLEKKLASLLN